MNTLELLTGPAAQAIGWALLHLLWQATIVAGILAAVLALMSRQSANARYVVSCGALAVVFAMFLATAIRAYDPAAEPIAPAAASSPSPETIRVSLEQLPVLLAETAAVGLRDRAIAAVASARNALPTIVGIWLAGVILLSSRLLVSWMRARRLVRHGSQPATPEWQSVAARLSGALGLRRAVTLLESAAVEVPSVIGSLRPIILIPASALTGLTPEQIEMVLAHELAHIRRHDFLVNLLQAVVETLMFYHPAVWWMSRRVRIERENCCDDLAVAVCGNPIQYARALTRLEELRASALPVVVAANGGSLLDRIRRIAAGRAEGTASSSRWAAAVAVLSILVIAVAVPSLPALAQREEKRQAEVPPPPPPVTAVEVIEAGADALEAVAEAGAEAVEDVAAEIDPSDADDDFDEWPGIAPAPAVLPAGAAVPAPALAPMPAPAPVHAVPAVTPHRMRAPRPPAVHIAGLDHADFEFDHDHDIDADHPAADDRELGSGKLTVDELISLRAVGVTPQYIDSMRALFPNLTVHQVTSLKAVGVSPEFVRDMRALGIDVKSAREATSLRAVGVSPEYVRQMREAGFTVTSARDATSLRAVGVTPEYVREMRGAGFTVQSAKDATSMRAVGVTPEWVAEMKAAGVEIKSAKDATSMRAVGVTPDFVRRLAKAGYTNLSVRELTRLAAAGIDEDFIREMEQYRKKN